MVDCRPVQLPLPWQTIPFWASPPLKFSNIPRGPRPQARWTVLQVGLVYGRPLRQRCSRDSVLAALTRWCARVGSLHQQWDGVAGCLLNILHEINEGHTVAFDIRWWRWSCA